MFRKFGAVLATAAMLTSSGLAFAADQQQTPQQQSTLAPGNSAGVEQARGLDTNVLLIALGIGLVAGGVALALSGAGSGNGNVSTTSTGG